MALNNDSYRVTKDTSARKNAPTSISALEVTAIKASYEAYISSIKSGHEDLVQNLQCDHADEVSALKQQSEAALTELKAQLSEERRNAAEKQRAAAEAATKKADTNRALQMTAYRDEISTLKKETTTLEAKLKDSISDGTRRESLAKQETAKLQSRFENLKKAHARELKDMQKQLSVGPNSWLQLQFKSKATRKPRIYWQRYTATLREAVEQLVKDTAGTSSEWYVFRRVGESGEVIGKNKTLQDVSRFRPPSRSVPFCGEDTDGGNRWSSWGLRMDRRSGLRRSEA